MNAIAFASRVTRGVAFAFALAIAIASASVGTGCKSNDASPERKVAPTAAPAVDTALMAYLSEARALHHHADIDEDRGKLDEAIATMKRLVQLRLPANGPKSPEVQEVLADSYARLAELELKLGNVVAAGQSLDKGFEHAPEATYFRGHLVELKGLLEEARAKALADAGQAAQAETARREAIRLFDEAVRIQDQFIERTLDAGGTKP